MLRGLDARGATDDEPTIIEVADRDPVDAEVTVFLDANASGAAAERQDEVAAELERLEAAGVIDAPSVVAWQDADVGARFEEFRDALVDAPLEPSSRSWRTVAHWTSRTSASRSGRTVR